MVLWRATDWLLDADLNSGGPPFPLWGGVEGGGSSICECPASSGVHAPLELFHMAALP